jgi:hypothetical protein
MENIKLPSKCDYCNPKKTLTSLKNSKYNRESDFNYHLSYNFYINHEYKVIFRSIYKNGISYVTSILKTYYEFVPLLINEKDFLDLYSNYKIFTFLRDPYKRFNSAINYLKIRNQNKITHSYEDIFSNNICIYAYNHLKSQFTFYDKSHNDWIGNTDYLSRDLCKALLHFGFKIVDTHWEIIQTHTRKNSSKELSNIEFTSELLEKINLYYKDDFEKLNLAKVETIDKIDLNSPKDNLEEIYELIKDNIILFSETNVYKKYSYLLDNKLDNEADNL